jgi:uncharacterized BrkB/YihY/UPF0761 family membrane protein
MADEPDPPEPAPLELDVAPTIPGRIARWTAKARVVRSQVEAARSRHPAVDLAFDLIERDSTIGGGMLGGALAYRLFVFLLPLSLFFVAGLGIYADTTDQSPSEVASSSGLTGLIATQVAAAASTPARWAIFIVTLPVLVYAAGMLYRAVAIVHAIAWHGSGRAVRLSSKGFGVFGGVIVAQFACTVIAGRIRRSDQVGGVTTLLVYALVLGGAWLAFARLLPRRDVGWKALVPGTAVVAVGMLFVNAFNVYVTSRLVEDRADTYGALGIATALLFSLYIVGRVIVGSAVLNATLDARRRRPPP